MRRLKIPAVALLAALSILFPAGSFAASAADQAAAFKAAVDQVFKVWAHSALAGDSVEFGTLWDTNAIKMANGNPTLIGQAGIQEFRRQKDAKVAFDTFDVQIQEYQLAGEFGWARGVYTLVVHPRAGGDPISDIGTFLTVFKKQADGSWKVYRDTMMTLPKT